MTKAKALPGDIVQILLQRKLAPTGPLSIPTPGAFQISGFLPGYGRYYRLMVMVKEIVDARRFVGIWRGHAIKCLAFPDTSWLSIGDAVIVTRLERGTEYFAWSTIGAFPYGLIIIWSGTRLNVPVNWRYCDGSQGTPDLRWTFPVGVGSTFPLHNTGGDDFYDPNPFHNHGLTDAAGPISPTSHDHTYTGNAGNEDSINPYVVGPASFVAWHLHGHTVPAGTVPFDSHAHGWALGATLASALANMDHRPRYRAYPYIMHMGAADDVPIGGIIYWSGLLASVPAKYLLCDGGGGTPNMTDRFVVCEDNGGSYVNGETGGADTNDLAHTHGIGSVLKINQATHLHPDETGTTNAGGPAGNTFFPLGAQNVAPPIIHNHNFTASQQDTGNHGHNASGSPDSALGIVTRRPVYYTLAFIQRMS